MKKKSDTKSKELVEKIPESFKEKLRRALNYTPEKPKESEKKK